MNDRFYSLNKFFYLFLLALLPVVATAQSPLDSLPPVDSLSDAAVNERAQAFAGKAAEHLMLLTEKSTAATAERAALEETWNTWRADSTVAKTDIDSLAALLKTAKASEKLAVKQQQQAAKTYDAIQKNAGADLPTQRKNLRKLWKELRQTDALLNPPAPVATVLPDEKPAKKEKKKKPAKDEIAPSLTPAPADSSASSPASKPTAPIVVRTKKYDPAADVMLNPPGIPCQLAVKTRDEFSGELYRRTTPVELFRHSPAALKVFLEGKANVMCETALAAAGNAAMLHLTFTIHDPSPRKAFGKLDKNSQLTLWFMDGASFVVYNQQTEEGTLNPETQAYVYRAQYALSADLIRKMRRTELDKIRVAWSSGYEDYDVQFVQLLMQQSKCLFD
jgi:hypothetical protein